MTDPIRTAIYKCPFHKAWKGETTVVLGDSQELRLLTRKTSSGLLVSGAQRVTSDGHFVTHRVYQDFNKTYIQSDVRVTEKAVRAQHDALLAQLDQIKKDCEDFYKKSGN